MNNTCSEKARRSAALLRYTPMAARRILAIGCADGALAAELQRRQPAVIIGLETAPGESRIARRRLDCLIEADADALEPGFPEVAFDAVVWEHGFETIREPLPFLRRLRSWLTPDGTLVLACPNLRQHTVIRALLAGTWTPCGANAFDRLPVRYYTRRELEKLLFRAGFTIDQTTFVPGEGHAAWSSNGRRAEICAGRMRLTRALAADVEEFYGREIAVSARPAPCKARRLTSIIIVTFNQLLYTQQCLDSISMRTDEPYELIVVDNASTDGTADYLRSLPGLTLIENTENRGFPAAVNQGLSAATGSQMLLLNNDTLATTGWLRRMLDALERDPRIGLVGPCSNCVSGPQQIPVLYQTLEELDGFAWDWGREHDGQLVDETRLVGFCLLIRGALIGTVGPFDERFGIGCFEDDDYCRRALDAGYRAVIARDAFVHHFGSRTFEASGVDFAALMRENQRKFEEKWAGSAPKGTSDPAHAPSGGRPRLVVSAAPEGGLRLRENGVKLSLCMIVRDNEGTIADCLTSIRPWVDEMVVVDTGSTDRTPEICRRLGARVFQFAWCDDFSAARNESLKHARGEWIFWMDSDDTISEENGCKLRALADGGHPDNLFGYVVQVHCPAPHDKGHDDLTTVDHLKLFRNRPDIRFEHRIHEQIIPAIRRAGGEVAVTDIFVVHSGADHTAEGRQRKLERDMRILALDLAERPDHPFVLFNLGMTYNDAGRHEEAVQHLERCVAVSQPQESHLRKAFALLAASLAQLGRREHALSICRDGLRHYPDDKELLFRSAMLHHDAGRLQDAETLYCTVLHGRERWHFSSVDRGLAGFKARHNLARVYEEMGRLAAAEEQWRTITADRPQYRAGWRGLAEVLIRQDKLYELKGLARRLELKGELRTTGRVLAALHARQFGDKLAARRELEKALESEPEDIDSLGEYCRLLFECFDPCEAEEPLRRMADLTPDDPSVHHNLGTICRRLRRFEDAVRHYARSLELRPDSPTTLLELGRAFADLDRPTEAVRVWQRGQALAPDHPELLTELRKVRPL